MAQFACFGPFGLPLDLQATTHPEIPNTQTDLSIIYNTQIYNADASTHIRVLPGGHLLQMAAARPDYHTTLT